MTRKIVYVGPKSEKVDKTAGTRQAFPRFEAVEVEKGYAFNLLRYPDVYVEEKDLPAAKARLEAIEAKKLAKAAALKAKKGEELQELSRVVVVDGENIDLGKYTSAKLNTFIEANDLDVDPKKPTEKIPEFCKRVFDAYQSKAE